MKKFILSSLALLVSLVVYAQQCTTRWPYLYSDFTEGTIYYKSGKTETKFLNIHILENRLHFINGEDINELKSTMNIAKVAIAKDVYIPFDGVLYRLMAEGDKGAYLGLLTSGDFKSLLESSGAYGSSSNSISANKLSSLDIGGIMGNTNHMNLKNNKDDGKEVPLVKKYFFICNGNLIAAKSKEVEKSFPNGEKKSQFKNFIRANKIIWSKPDDLAKVLAVL